MAQAQLLSGAGIRPYGRRQRIRPCARGRPHSSDAHWHVLSGIAWLYTGLTVDRSFLREHRNALVRFLKATIEGGLG
jgi:hypothetical protein